jgi:uncharacterized repeat protein (TIGR01451 family)
MKNRVKTAQLSIAPVLLALGTLLSVPAFAQTANDGGPNVKVNISVVQDVTRTAETGETVVESKPVGLVSPGDVLTYTLTAQNTGDSPAFDARIEDPIPDGTVLLTGSIPESISGVTASIDGGESWRSFPVFVVTGSDDDGQPIYEQAAAESYTHLRWLLDAPLSPGATKEVSFKVQVR